MTDLASDRVLKRALGAHRAGRLDEAEIAYVELLQMAPKHADAAHLLGLTRHQCGQNDSALEAVEYALSLNGGAANFHNSHGLVLHALGRFPAAETALKVALSLAPNDADAHNNLGLVYTAQRRFALAVDSLARSLEIRPRYPAALNNFGRALVAMGRAAEAVAHLKLACELEPSNAGFINTLGVALRESGRYEEAQLAYEHALNLDPTSVDAHVSYAQLLLTNGDFAAGWPELEWRLRRPEHQRRPSRTRWDGKSPLEGKKILLWAEQGLGDAIQFVRYARNVSACGATVVVECAPSLHRLFADAPGVSAVVAPDDPAAVDLHCPLMSLPGYFEAPSVDTDAADTNANAKKGTDGATPYLSAPQLSARQLMDLGDGVKIGLVWAGNPRHANDANRSASLEAFAPLAVAFGPKASFFGLQKGPAVDQKPPSNMVFENLGPRLNDFQDTASALMALDVLITVDTSVAHLAGALGRPVWVLLPAVADWRWLRDRNDSPWYPSMRLFRRDGGDNWSGVVNQIADKLLREFSEFK